MNPAMPMSTRTSVRPFVMLSGLLTCLVMLPPPSPAYAQQHPIGPVVVSSGETVSEVSTAVGDVTVNGNVDGDVETGHGNILLNGPVDGDASTTLGNVNVRAPVNGDIEVEVGTVRVDSEVGGDIDVGNGDVILGPDAHVGGDVECGSGRILGNREDVQGDIRVGMASGMDHPFGEARGPGILGFLGWVLLTLVFAACTVLASVLAPGTLTSVTRSLERSPGRSFLFGVVSVPMAVILGLVLGISLVGIPLLIILAPAYLAFVFFGALAAAFFVGRKVLLVTGRHRGGNALAAVVGAIAVSATSLIPFVGDLVMYALALLGAGATIVALMNRRRSHPGYGPYGPYDP